VSVPYFNCKKYSYCGHVYQGRFSSKIIEGDVYMMQCLNYIHNNPVKAKLVSSPDKYCWSSYHLYYDQKNPNIDEILTLDKYGDTLVVTS
jgi:putative transposase